MAPRKKKKKKKTARVRKKPAGIAGLALTGPLVDDEGLLQFSPLDLSRYDLAQHRCANTLQGVQLKKNELETVRRAAEQRVRQIEVEIEQLQKTAKEHAAELKQLQDELEKAYGIDLSRITFDDATGRIYLDGEPVRAAKEKHHGRA